MQYDVELSQLAEKQYDNILGYLAYKLKNPQAVAAVIDDFDTAVSILEKSPTSFSYCQSEKLKALGLRKFHFEKHKYLFVYRIVESKVIIEGVYHELQDYENAIQ